MLRKMLKKGKSKTKTLSEKVTELLTNPNREESEEESAGETAVPRVVEFDDEEYQLPDARSTEFRKRNVKLLSEQSARYRGKIATRKELEEDEEEEGSEQEDTEYEASDDSESDDGARAAFTQALKDKQLNSVEDDDDGDDDDDGASEEKSEDDAEKDKEDTDGADETEETEESNEEEDEEDMNDVSPGNDEENEVLSKTNYEAEIQKGICVQNQLRLWERLLEIRIHSQKLLNKANQLPSPADIQQLEEEDTRMQDTRKEVTAKTTTLLKALVELQDTLSNQFTELRDSMQRSRKRPSPFQKQNEDDSRPPIKQLAEHLAGHFDEFRGYRNAVLLKWDDRTKLAVPGAGARKKSLNEEFDIIRKIDNALINKDTLIEKCQQLKNSNNAKSVPGGSTELEEDSRGVAAQIAINPNIYDDSDFYHQQLRELIEYKANTSSNMSEITKQYVELQKLRQKMKKKVDTRASKGRKLRYVVHNKLINFMAPNDDCNWTDESKDELCKSLFM